MNEGIKALFALKYKKDTRKGDSALLVDIPSGWDPQAKQQPTGLIAYSANCVVRAALFKSRLP